MITFKRKIYDQLLLWKKESKGRVALLIEGARRIGKSTIVSDFAKKEYKSHVIIDFSNTTSEVIDLFHDMSDLNYFFFRLQFIFNVKLEERNSIIVFDEVQFQPKARQSIKALVADGRYDYIETGSLISIRKNVQNILIPSEERKIEMYPMDYEEFRWALNDTATIPLLKHAFDENIPLGQAHRKLMRDFRLYMAIGGMPQAVSEYIENNNLTSVDEVKRDILNLYIEDFRKIDASGRMSQLFKAIPAQLTGNSMRYNVSNVLNGYDAIRTEELLADMLESKVINASYMVTDPEVGLSLSMDLRRYKLFLADTGLFVTLTFWDKALTENIIYQKLLNDKLRVNLGYVYENVVAQMLVARGNKLFYHTFPTENKKHNYEVDFLLSRGTKICPLEVKSSEYKTHASIDAFCKKFSSRIDQRYLIYTKDMQKDGSTLCIPTYMAYFI